MSLVTSKFVGSLDAFNEPTMPFEAYRKILEIFNEDPSYLDFLSMMGKRKKTEQTEFYHFRDQLIAQPVTVASKTGTAGVGNPCTVVLNAASHTDAGKTSYAREGDILLNNATGSRMFVRSKNTTTDSAHSLVLVNPTKDLVTEIAAGTILVVIGQASVEGSDSPEPRKYGMTRRNGSIQIHKHQSQITDIAEGQAQVFDFAGQRKMLPWQLFKAERDFQQKIFYDLFLGENMPGLLDKNGNAVLTSKSLDQYVTSGGINKNLAAAITANDVYDITLSMNRADCPTDNLWWAGYAQRVDLDKMLHTMPGVDQGAIDWSNFGVGNAKGNGVDFRLKDLSIGGFRFKLGTIKAFSNPNLTATTNSRWPNTGFIIPADQAKAYSSGQKMEMRDRVCLREFEVFGKTYRRDEIGKYASQGATNSTSKLEVHFEAHVGLEVVGEDKIIKVART